MPSLAIKPIGREPRNKRNTPNEKEKKNCRKEGTQRKGFCTGGKTNCSWIFRFLYRLCLFAAAPFLFRVVRVFRGSTQKQFRPAPACAGYWPVCPPEGAEQFTWRLKPPVGFADPPS